MKFGYFLFLNPSIQFDIPLCKTCKYYSNEKCKGFETKNVITNEITLEDAPIARKKYCGVTGTYYTPSEIKYTDLRRVGLLPV
jgi:hypothetical protein